MFHLMFFHPKMLTFMGQSIAVAAMTPPSISPNTSNKGMCLRRIKKVVALAKTTKNSARQTEPIT